MRAKEAFKRKLIWYFPFYPPPFVNVPLRRLPVEDKDMRPPFSVGVVKK